MLERRDVDLLELLEHLDVVVAIERLQSPRAPWSTISSVRGAVDGRLRGARRSSRRRRGAGVPRRVVLLDRVGDRGLRRDDRLDVVARHELDVVHGEDVGRIRHRDRQRRAGRG